MNTCWWFVLQHRYKMFEELQKSKDCLVKSIKSYALILEQENCCLGNAINRIKMAERSRSLIDYINFFDPSATLRELKNFKSKITTFLLKSPYGSFPYITSSRTWSWIQQTNVCRAQRDCMLE